MMVNFFLRPAVVLIMVIIPVIVFATEYKATLAKMPVYAISETEGVLVDLVNEIKKTTGDKISIGVYPFARSMDNVIKGKADFHIPLIKNDIIPEEELPYYYSTATIFHVNFVLYTVKGSSVTLDNLAEYKVETDRAHVDYFPFEIIPSSSIEQSIKKLEKGRIEAFIFADTATDPVLKQLGIKNLQRRLYKRFDVKIILPKTAKGQETDKMLSSAIKKSRENGSLAKIEALIDKPYDDWQP